MKRCPHLFPRKTSKTSMNKARGRRELEVAARAKVEDLPDVMPTVNEMKRAPLVNAERAQNLVGDAASLAKEVFGLIEELVDASQTFGGGAREIFARESIST